MSSESTLRFYAHAESPVARLTWELLSVQEGIPRFEVWLTREQAVDALESLTRAVAELRRREQ